MLFVITTDGMENASKEFTYKQINNMIKHQEQQYNWEFLFMGANIDVEKEAEQLGVRAENSMVYEASSEGIQEMYSVRAAELVERRRK